jgi:hypothetical protein
MGRKKGQKNPRLNPPDHDHKAGKPRGKGAYWYYYCSVKDCGVFMYKEEK